ncbi:hypothetical protein [Deinococcus sp. YIM 77859]|nr:hypothetical protein [Deinococcus sp. YIM 77859]
MPIKKTVKVLAVLAAVVFSVAQAGPPDYGVAAPAKQTASQATDLLADR